jgi:hypothetical protein
MIKNTNKMRKIAAMKWIQRRYHTKDGEQHLVSGTNEYSKTEFEYVGYFHKWVIINKDLFAVVELEDGTIVLGYWKWVKFIDTPKC